MTSKFLHCLILGAPASGKGTISSRIVKYFNIKHIASGDLLRSHIQNNTDLGKVAQKYVNDGQLVPDSVMMNLITNRLSELSATNWLLDGFPRTKHQAEDLFSKYPIDVALNLVVPFEIIIERVRGRWIHVKSGRIYNDDFNAPKIKGKDDITGEDLVQRPDDKPEAVKKRLEIYSNTIAPVLQFYKDAGTLHEFYGETSDAIWPQVKNYLSTSLEPKLKE